jgi:hypothetical protein
VVVVALGRGADAAGPTVATLDALGGPPRATPSGAALGAGLVVAYPGNDTGPTGSACAAAVADPQ